MENIKVKLIHHTPFDVMRQACMLPYKAKKLSAEKIAKIALSSTERYGERHGSVMEHISLHFHIKGSSRLELQEHMRHRIASPTVESTRFVLKKILNMEPVEFLDNIDLFPVHGAIFINKDGIVGEECAKTELKICQEDVDEDGYTTKPADIKDIINSKAFKLISRYFVIPPYMHIPQENRLSYLSRTVETYLTSLTNLYWMYKNDNITNDYLKYSIVESWRTEFMWTINLRSYLNFMRLRNPGTDSHFEIQEVARQSWECVTDPSTGELHEFLKFVFR